MIGVTLISWDTMMDFSVSELQKVSLILMGIKCKEIFYNIFITSKQLNILMCKLSTWLYMPTENIKLELTEV
jgi:hypothetical protein